MTSGVEQNDLTIRLGLPEDQRRRAAEIFYAAFAPKFRFLMDRERGVAILESVFDPGCAIVALIGGQVVGIAGFNQGRRRLTRWAYGPFIRAFGLPRGLIKGTLIRFDHRVQTPGQLLMDGLAVDAAYRGQGIGTALLEAVCAYAREHGYTSVRLDVVDTNPRARALYERFGFAPTRTHNVEVARRFIGFGRYTTMVKGV